MTRFRTISEEHTDGSETVTVAEAVIREGHTVTRTRHERTTYAGRKGRAASVERFEDYRCTCGGHTVSYGGTVAEAMGHLRHFDSTEEREAYERAETERTAAVLRSLGTES